MRSKNSSSITVKDIQISVTTLNEADYICLTDMVKGFDNRLILIVSWLRSKSTIEFLGTWEVMNNPRFNSIEFDRIKSESGSNRFILTSKRWIENTNAMGIIAKTGRYGGTYAHRDIAFEFGSWLSPEFKLLLIKEFQRLKEKEQRLEQWDYRRFLSKVNYRILTDSVKEVRIPKATLPKEKMGVIYAEEADLVNVALFEITAADWRKEHPEDTKGGANIRDHASIQELTVLSNLESINSLLLREGRGQYERLVVMRKVAIDQLRSLSAMARRRLIGPSE
ncbi:MAG: KilA-N domain-containing protein [Candidatus Gracilibacteria bacterium]